MIRRCLLTGAPPAPPRRIQKDIFFFCCALTMGNGWATEVSPSGSLVAKHQSIKGAAYENLLVKAAQQIKRGSADAAYLELQPFEFEHAGDERFDNLLGVAALESGRPDKATLALERVLVENPGATASRMDLARAYSQLGDLPRAKTEFTMVLAQIQNGETRSTVEKYLDEINSRERWGGAHLSGFLEASVGHDSNVNNSTEQTQVFVGGIALNLDPTNIQTADRYSEVKLGGAATYDLVTSLGVYAEGSLRRRQYGTQSGFDASEIESAAGLSWHPDSQQFRVGFQDGQTSLGGAKNSTGAGTNADWTYSFSPSNQVRFFGQNIQYRYMDVAMQPNDFNQQITGGGWTHIFPDGRSSLFGSVYSGSEQDVSTLITMATPHGGRTDGPSSLKGFRLGGRLAIDEEVDGFINGGMQSENYDRMNPFFLVNRADKLSDLTAGFDWKVDKKWSVRPQMIYSRDNSNILIYGFRRVDASVTIRRDFY